MKQLSSHQFKNIYTDLKLDVETLGCVMLDVNGNSILPLPPEDLYYTKNKKRFWIRGFVAGKTPHVTLLYGLLKPAIEWKKHVYQVLDGWSLPTVTIKDIGYFASQYDDDPYYCIVAHLDITDKLLEGHQRLQFLPHIDTFMGYKAHITLAYVKEDTAIRDNALAFYSKNLSGKRLAVLGINLGNVKN